MPADPGLLAVAWPADHGPKFTLVAGTPRSRRCHVSPSRGRRCRAVGGLPVAAPHRGDRGGGQEEVQVLLGPPHTRCSAKFQAPQTFRRTPDPVRHRPGNSAGGGVLAGGVDDAGQCRQPAATVLSRRATSCGSATSAVTTRTVQPCPAGARRRGPGWCRRGARRLVSTRFPAPWAARYPAISADGAETAGDQIASVGTQLQRRFRRRRAASQART